MLIEKVKKERGERGTTLKSDNKETMLGRKSVTREKGTRSVRYARDT